MNFRKLATNLGELLRLHPPAELRNPATERLEPSDDVWQLTEVDPSRSITLVNVRSGQKLKLAEDHVHHFTNASPADTSCKGTLELTVRVDITSGVPAVSIIPSGVARTLGGPPATALTRNLAEQNGRRMLEISAGLAVDRRERGGSDPLVEKQYNEANAIRDELMALGSEPEAIRSVLEPWVRFSAYLGCHECATIAWQAVSAAPHYHAVAPKLSDSLIPRRSLASLLSGEPQSSRRPETSLGA